MPLQKQALAISFNQGLDTKTDDKQITPGKFLSLENSVFTKGGLLQKRNGFGSLPSLPDSTSSYLTTFNGNLTAIGNKYEVLSIGSQNWSSKGSFTPLSLSTLPLVRSNTNQVQVDSAVSSNQLVCTVFSDVTGSTVYKYVVADSITGQNIIAPNFIVPSAGVVSGAPRVFFLGNFFIMVFTATISGTAHLQYVAININTLVISTAVDISTTYTPASTLAFDGVVANNNLYIALNGSDGGGAVRVTYIDSTLVQHNTVVVTGTSGTIFSVTADTTASTAVIWVSYYNSSTPVGNVLAFNQALAPLPAFATPIAFTLDPNVVNLASAASNGQVTIFSEIANSYSYSSSIAGDTNNATNYIQAITLDQSDTVISALATIVRSVGLASKAFAINGIDYFLGIYTSLFQPTYFLINGSGQVVSRLAYSNGGSYYTTGLPGVTINGTIAQIPYFYKDLIQAANKTQVGTPTGIYTQTGINLVTYIFGTNLLSTAEIGSNLNITGGFLWAYDGFQPVEQNFFLWPDHIGVTTATGGGSVAAGTYFYQVIYEWSDNQGNIFNSAPSVPVSQTTTTSNSTNTIKVPTLRLTYKTANPVKIVIYRWSLAQQTYFQVTSLTSPLINNPAADSVSFSDNLSDAQIAGNSILYTTGGVVEDIGPPSFNALALYKSRLFGVDAEDPNLLWYSKQVIEATPVEMSDLFTIYVAPSQAAQGSTGPITALSALDDKLIIFKKDAIYYITGNGPDNTGANDDFSDPVFITSTVGCANANSIVFMPNGLMFQSDKGIWLLGRDLSTNYIGAPVEVFNSALVLSALNIPATNQVRFTLSNGVTLMYDYFYNQWGTFNGIPAISSTLYQGLHTFINLAGMAFQETPQKYLDGTNPVLLSFKTGWFNLAGLQGYQRIYYFYLLGSYFSPHKLSLQIAYDYSDSPSQQILISPDNYNAPWGGDPTWGQSTPWGGQPQLEQWRVFMQRQRCQAFQLTLTEVFDAFYGVVGGAGFTLSGLNFILGLKKQYKPIAAKNSVG